MAYAYPETPELAPLTAEEVAAINEILQAFGLAYPSLREVLLEPKNLNAVMEVVRAVKKKSNTSFKGVFARGDELTLRLLRPGDILKNNSAMTTWLFSATAGTDWFESGASDAPLTMDEYEGRAYLGWADPIETPRAISVQLEIGGDLQYVQTLDFELVDADKSPVIKNVVPWQIRPLKQYRIQVRYDSTGNDALRPIGVRVAKFSTLQNI